MAKALQNARIRESRRGEHRTASEREAGLPEQRRERHAGPFRRGDEAVRALHRRLGRLQATGNPLAPAWYMLLATTVGLIAMIMMHETRAA
jgi:hypothetical protein